MTDYNLAPLKSRRDMAMLGLIHKTVLGQAHPDFSKFFRLSFEPRSGRTRSQNNRHAYTLQDDRISSELEVWRRSAAGLIPTYNRLPENVVMTESVQAFQRSLQNILKVEVKNNNLDWQSLFSPSQ